MQITQNADVWCLSGDLVVKNITQVLDDSKLLEMPANLQLDFAEVSEVDTSAISLILEFQRRAIQQQAQVTVLNVPDNLLRLMQLYGVDTFIIRN
ncbi:MAG: STAS domain-containing protein [Methylophilus sp.]|nr:STAS domain-containing protein [Methylophilus sp.]